MRVTENLDRDLSMTIEEISTEEAQILFMKGLRTMLDEFKEGDHGFVVVDPKEFGGADEHLKDIEESGAKWEISDEEYDQVIQIGIVQILKEEIHRSTENENEG